MRNVHHQSVGTAPDSVKKKINIRLYRKGFHWTVPLERQSVEQQPSFRQRNRSCDKQHGQTTTRPTRVRGFAYELAHTHYVNVLHARCSDISQKASLTASDFIKRNTGMIKRNTRSSSPHWQHETTHQKSSMLLRNT